MPEMDGVEASRRILQMDKNARILLSSGYDGDEVTSISSSLDITFLHKPYKLSSLRQMMVEILKDGSAVNEECPDESTR